MSIRCNVPEWTREKAMVCGRIGNHHAPLKILLKTKDDPGRLEPWIAHHSAIAGLENLIVFDNMSTDETVLDIYARYESEFPIIRFAGFYDIVHHTAYFGELYEALRTSCRHFVFLDTDECLGLYDGFDSLYFDERMITYLSQKDRQINLPGTWLQNLRGFENRFEFGESGHSLRRGLKWGKPIISTSCQLSGMINHNTQIKASFAADTLCTRIFVLHRSQTSAAQRISANLQKLRACQILAPDGGVDDALALDIRVVERGAKYVQEIQSLVAAGLDKASIEDSIEIDPEGRIRWGDASRRAQMQNFIARPLDYSDLLFSD
jgi:hypothetical protein